MAKKYPNIQTLEVYQEGGDIQQVTPCPDATIDQDLNLDNRERAISRFNYGKANSEDKCGNCILFDISKRMKKCIGDNSGNTGYCWSNDFKCSKENVCDSYEKGGPLKKDDSSYSKQDQYASDYEESKETVEQIQEGLQMPGLNEPAVAPQEEMVMQQQVPEQSMQPQQAMIPEQQMPTFEYGGSLRRFQDDGDNDDVEGMADAETNYPGAEDNNRSEEDIINEVESEVAKADECAARGGNYNSLTGVCEGLDNNTDIFDAKNNQENQILNKFADWQTKRGKRRRARSNRVDTKPFMMYNAGEDTNILSDIVNLFQSGIKDFQNFDVDPNKITKKEFRNFKKVLREQNPDASKKEINQMAKLAFPSAGNNRWGKENYQQFKVTNPFDETRFFDPTQPDKLITYEEKRMNEYNQYVNNRTAAYPDLYQISSMDMDGNITYQGDKLLGDMIETEYVPDAVMLVHNEDNTGIQGSYVFDGVDERGQKKYKYIPFDAENPTNITYEKSSQQTANDCFELQEKCAQLTPPGDWDAANCKCNEPTSQETNNQSVPEDANLDDMEFDPDLKYGGSTPTFSFLRDGGDLMYFQNKSEIPNWTDQQLELWLKMQEDLLALGAGYGDARNPNYRAGSINIKDKSTWPQADEFNLYSRIIRDFPNFPNPSTKEGRSQLYNLNKQAQEWNLSRDPFLQYETTPNVFWTIDNEGQVYPYRNETVEDKEIRTGNFTNYENALKFLHDNKNVINPNMLKIDGKQFTFPTSADALAYAAEYNLNPSALTVQGNPFLNISDYQKDFIEKYRLNENIEENARWNKLHAHKYDTDISGMYYDANLAPHMNSLYKQWETAEKKSGVDNFPPFHHWVKNVDQTDYKPDYQIITKDNAQDAIKGSFNPYFEGSMSGYGGGALGSNTGNQEIMIDGETVTNPMFVDYGRNPEMNTLMGYIPALVGGVGAVRGGLALANRFASFTVPGSAAIGAPVTFGQLNNAYWTQEALRNTLPEAYRDFSEGRTGEGFGNLALGTLELSGIGNTGLVNILPKNFNQLKTLNPTFPALNQKGVNFINSRLTTPSPTNINIPFSKIGGKDFSFKNPIGPFVDKIKGPASSNYQMPLFNVNPFSKRTTQLDMLKNYTNKDFSSAIVNPLYAPQRLTTTPGINYNAFSNFKQTGGSLYKAQNGSQDVAAMYMVNPEQFDYEAGMPKEGAISAYGDVWQGGQWVDATEENQGFNTPDSDQFNVVGDAFSDETGTINRNVGSMFTANAVNQGMKTAAADTYDVRRKDIDMNTFKPKEGSINRSYGDVFNTEQDMFVDQANVTPEFDVTDDFAFEGDGNTLSRRQLRDVRRNKRREDKAIEAGFESYEDMQAAKEEEKTLRKQRRQDRRDRWGDTFGERMRNRLNYIKDSKVVQGFEKGAKFLKEAAGIGNKIFDQINEGKEQAYNLATRSADDAYSVMAADTLSRGEEDENVGLMFGDRVIARQDSRSQYGSELPRAQQNINMDSSTSMFIPKAVLNSKLGNTTNNQTNIVDEDGRPITDNMTIDQIQQFNMIANTGDHMINANPENYITGLTRNMAANYDFEGNPLIYNLSGNIISNQPPSNLLYGTGNPNLLQGTMFEGNPMYGTDVGFDNSLFDFAKGVRSEFRNVPVRHIDDNSPFAPTEFWNNPLGGLENYLTPELKQVVEDKSGYMNLANGSELPNAQYGFRGTRLTNPRFGVEYQSGEHPLNLFFGADMVNCWGGSCRDAGGGRFKRGVYTNFSPFETTEIDNEGNSFNKMTAAGDIGARLRLDQDFYGLPTPGPAGIMLEGYGGMDFNNLERVSPYYGGRAGLQFKTPVPQTIYKSGLGHIYKDKHDYVPQGQLDLFADYKSNEGLKVGAQARYGLLNAGVSYNPSTSNWEYSGGLGFFFKDGGEQKEKTVSIDTDMYYELLAAGADIEII